MELIYGRNVLNVTHKRSGGDKTMADVVYHEFTHILFYACGEILDLFFCLLNLLLRNKRRRLKPVQIL